MKRIFYSLIYLLTISCNNGNLDIASFEFEEKVNVCGEFTLYRLSTNDAKETLIVTLTDKEIRNDDTVVIPVIVTENGPYTVTDRVFDTTVTSDYFCAAVPPAEPQVLKNWQGVSGLILVQNSPVFDPDDGVTIIAWQHIIILNDVVLKSGEESLIFNDTFVYGTFETSN